MKILFFVLGILNFQLAIAQLEIQIFNCNDLVVHPPLASNHFLADAEMPVKYTLEQERIPGVWSAIRSEYESNKSVRFDNIPPGTYRVASSLPGNGTSKRTAVFIRHQSKTSPQEAAVWISESFTIGRCFDPALTDDVMTVFPNPCTEKFRLYIEEESDQPIEVGIYDMMGRKLKCLFLDSVNQAFSTDDLKPGVYMIRALTNSPPSRSIKLIISE